MTETKNVAVEINATPSRWGWTGAVLDTLPTILLVGFGVFIFLHQSMYAWAAVYSVLIVPSIYLGSRFPLRTRLSGSILTTTGLFGQRTIDLNRVVRARVAALDPHGVYATYGMKITDDTGSSAVIQLGSLSHADRDLLREPILAALNRPEVDGNRRVLALWDDWYAYKLPKKKFWSV